ncbi:MAG: DNA-directed RNA polymerase subunit omega [Acidobacteriota bacterium]
MADVALDSAFRTILIAAERAEQLINGARPRLESRFAKPATIALDELTHGLVPWRPVTAEEYEQLRLQKLEARAAEDHAPVFLRPPLVEPLPAEEAAEAEEEPLDEDLDEEFDDADYDDLEDFEEVVGDEGGEPAP